MARCAAAGEYMVLSAHEHICEREQGHAGLHRCRNYRQGCKTKWASCFDRLFYNGRSYSCERYDGHTGPHRKTAQTWRDRGPTRTETISDCNQVANAGTVYFRHDGQHVCRKPYGHDGVHTCRAQFCNFTWEQFFCFDSGECELTMNHSGAHQKDGKYWVGELSESGAQRVISEIINSCSHLNLSIDVSIRDDGTYNLNSNIDLADVLARLNAPTNFTGLEKRIIKRIK